MSRASLVCRLAVPLLSIAAAAQAGTVYVPLGGVAAVGPQTWSPAVSVGNPGDAAIQVKPVQIPGDTDGTVRPTPPTPSNVDPGHTMVLQPEASFRGLLELSGSPVATYAARLVSNTGAGALGVALPVITSENLTAGGSALALHGLQASASRTTHVAIDNLEQYAAQCTLSLVRSDGTALGQPRAISLLPLTQTWIADALNGLVDAAGATDVRAAVSCDRDFFAWALVADSTSGQLTVIDPAGSGTSLLTVPGEQAPCPPGATCQSSDLVFTPTPANSVGHIVFPAPVGTFTRLRLEMEVTVGQWYPKDPDGKHLIYWFVINKNIDMPGMLYFRGPATYSALVRYGIGLKHPQKLKILDPNFHAVPGRTYHVVNDFDMGAHVYTVTITDVASGQVVSTLRGVPNVPKVTIKAGSSFLVDMGFSEGAVPDEVPSFNGWVYDKVRVDAIP